MTGVGAFKKTDLALMQSLLLLQQEGPGSVLSACKAQGVAYPHSDYS